LKIAVLGWGSLVWDPQDLSVRGGFKADGPRLPVEFCRISRDGRLTLVIDETVGVVCITFSALSSFDTLEGAIRNLIDREKTGATGIGFAGRRTTQPSVVAKERHPQALKTIERWITYKKYDCAIWTALESNFCKETHQPFSVDAAIRYLESLDEKSLTVALDYIRRAPREVHTPVREGVAARWPT
jgi:hypothetical protein